MALQSQSFLFLAFPERDGDRAGLPAETGLPGPPQRAAATPGGALPTGLLTNI